MYFAIQSWSSIMLVFRIIYLIGRAFLQFVLFFLILIAVVYKESSQDELCLVDGIGKYIKSAALGPNFSSPHGSLISPCIPI